MRFFVLRCLFESLRLAGTRSRLCDRAPSSWELQPALIRPKACPPGTAKAPVMHLCPTICARSSGLRVVLSGGHSTSDHDVMASGRLQGGVQGQQEEQRQ